MLQDGGRMYTHSRQWCNIRTIVTYYAFIYALSTYSYALLSHYYLLLASYCCKYLNKAMMQTKKKHAIFVLVIKLKLTMSSHHPEIIIIYDDEQKSWIRFSIGNKNKRHNA